MFSHSRILEQLISNIRSWKKQPGSAHVWHLSNGMKVAVLINNSAGSMVRNSPALASREIARAFREQGIETELHFPPRNRMASLAGSLASAPFDAVVAGGGDGTISSVAEALTGGLMPLGVLPLGTRNHFARDLGIPPDLSSAVTVIAGRHVSRIDVGEVNGHIFINNSSIGTYPRAVDEREQDRKRFGWPKWLAMIVATLKVFRRQPLVRVRLELDGKEFFRTTPFVFVGNNLYTVNLLEVRFRSCLTAGQLCVYCANCDGFLCVLRLFWLALCNRLDQAEDFESRAGSELLIHPARSRIRVAKDGEVFKLDTPLRYRVRRAALPVLTPVTMA